MDGFAISLVQIWNALADGVGADSLMMRETVKNGYQLGLLLLVLFSGGGLFFFADFEG